MMKEMVMEQIAENLHKAVFFTVLADKLEGVSKKEELRTVFDKAMMEHWLCPAMLMECKRSFPKWQELVSHARSTASLIVSIL